jgi:hypothetical protein
MKLIRLSYICEAPMHWGTRVDSSTKESLNPSIETYNVLQEVLELAPNGESAAEEQMAATKRATIEERTHPNVQEHASSRIPSTQSSLNGLPPAPSGDTRTCNPWLSLPARPPLTPRSTCAIAGSPRPSSPTESFPESGPCTAPTYHPSDRCQSGSALPQTSESQRRYSK